MSQEHLENLIKLLNVRYDVLRHAFSGILSRLKTIENFLENRPHFHRVFPPVVNLPRRQPVPPPGQPVVAAPRPIAVPRFRLVQEGNGAFGSYGGANGHLSQDNWVDLSPFCSRFDGEIGYDYQFIPAMTYADEVLLNRPTMPLVRIGVRAERGQKLICAMQFQREGTPFLVLRKSVNDQQDKLWVFRSPVRFFDSENGGCRISLRNIALMYGKFGHICMCIGCAKRMPVISGERYIISPVCRSHCGFLKSLRFKIDLPPEPVRRAVIDESDDEGTSQNGQ